MLPFDVLIKLQFGTVHASYAASRKRKRLIDEIGAANGTSTHSRQFSFVGNEQQQGTAILATFCQPNVGIVQKKVKAHRTKQNRFVRKWYVFVDN